MTAIELRAELFREMSPLLDNESAMTKMLAFVKSLVPAKKTKTESDWANRFVGAWKDSRSAEEIISDIRESRTANSREFEITRTRPRDSTICRLLSRLSLKGYRILSHSKMFSGII